jgi:AcrR family transcriptional regulator
VGWPRSQMVAIQRSRILAAAVGVVDECGYADTSVADIVERSRVSRRTFYQMFSNREECLAAVVSDAIERVKSELEGAGLSHLPWRERLRVGLWTILSFLDREPALAKVCVVQALGCGGPVPALREEALAWLARVVDEGRLDSGRAAGSTPLTAEGLVGAAYMIVHTRLLRRPAEPLSGLFGELVGLIVLPYRGAAAARREQARPAPSAIVSVQGAPMPPAASGDDPLQGVTMRLTYRTARVLEGVGEHAGASNRQVADHAGIADPGQISKLLRRLERLGLLENRGGGHAQGEPNEWRLTAKGELVTEGIRMHASQPRKAA